MDQSQLNGSNSTSSPPDTKRPKSSDNDHGNWFQWKLLFLFFIRAINKGYQFHVATELEEFGGKFDDLVFLKDCDQPVKSFLYLQAKHKQDEKKKIKATDLITKNDDNFSLTKYFHSCRDYVMKAEKGPQSIDNVDCVICTNADLDKDDLEKNGITLTQPIQNIANHPREILVFKPIQRSSPIDKMEIRNYWWSVASYLRDCAKNPTSPPDPPSKDFQSKVATLIQNSAIVSNFSLTETMTFHQDFIDGVNLSEDAKKLREIIGRVEKNDNWKSWEFSLDNKKIPICYRLEPIRWLEMHYVANVLRDCAMANQGKQLLDKQGKQFKSYQAALIAEKVIDLETKTFHQDFIDGKDLSESAKKLRNIIDAMVTNGSWTKWKFSFNDIKEFCNPTGVSRNRDLDDWETEKEIKDFFNKFTFAINTPNEEELDGILKEEVGQYFNLLDTDLQSTYILSQMINWFKREENVWLSAENGKEMLYKVKEKINLLRLTAVSMDYRKQLNTFLKFNDKTIDKMTEKLECLLKSSVKMERIYSSSPKFSAIQVIAALERLEDYKPQDSYLIFPIKRLQQEDDILQLKKLLSITERSHFLLVIVCEKSDSVGRDQFEKLTNLIPDGEEGKKRKKGIVIMSSAEADAFSFSDLSEASKNGVFDKCVSFQGKETRVRNLLQNDNPILDDTHKPENVFDILSLTELMTQEENIVIPSFDTDTRFNKSLYIKRCMRFLLPLDDQFLNEIIAEINEKNACVSALA